MDDLGFKSKEIIGKFYAVFDRQTLLEIKFYFLVRKALKL